MHALCKRWEQIAAIALFDIADQDCMVSAFVAGVRCAIECDCRAAHSGKVAVIEFEDITGELVRPSSSESQCDVDLLGVNHVHDPFVGGLEHRVTLRVSGQAHQDKGRVDRERAEGTGGESPPLALVVDCGHDGDSTGKPSHGVLEADRSIGVGSGIVALLIRVFGRTR